MSSTRHPVLHRWSPLHPPLARSAPVLQPTPSDQPECAAGAAVLDPQEGGERLAALREE